MRTYEYKGFGIAKRGSKFLVYYQGIMIRACKTLKECKRRIDEQTI